VPVNVVGDVTGPRPHANGLNPGPLNPSDGLVDGAPDRFGLADPLGGSQSAMPLLGRE
jgi:hypothetical protein